MESINNDLNKNYNNYSIKTCKNDELNALNGSNYMYTAMKSQYKAKYPEFTTLHKHSDYLSLYDINKVEFSNHLSKNDSHKRHSGYFNLSDGNKHLKSVNEDSNYKPFINKVDTDDKTHQKSIDSDKTSSLDLKESDKADTSVSETSLPETCVRKLSFGKSPDQTHNKLADLNEDIKSDENEVNNSNQTIETQITTVYKKEEPQASPLFLKIMSKLSELPDSMLFTSKNSNTNNDNEINSPTSTNNENASNTSSINNSNINNESNNSSDSKTDTKTSNNDYASSTLPAIRLNEKTLKSLNKRNIVIVRRPTAPAPTPPQLVAKQNLNNSNLNRSLNKDKAPSYLESNILQKQSLNVMQRTNLKSKDEKRVKHRSMYVESDVYKKEYIFESDLSGRKSEKYTSHLVDGLNVFANPTSYLTKIRELETKTDDNNNNGYKEFRKNLLKDLEYEKKKSSANHKRDEHQIEESLKCFSYLDNLDDSLSMDDNKLAEQLASTNGKNYESKYSENDRYKSLKQLSSGHKTDSNDPKELTSLTIHTPSSINYNIRMNTDESTSHKTHHSDEPSIKLRAKNNELVASINIMEASLTNSVKKQLKSEHRESREIREPKSSNVNSNNSVIDEKIEEIEKTANFDLSSNESETENSYDTRKSSKKNIIIKKVKTEQSSPKKCDNLRMENANTAKITNNYNNNIVIINSSQKTPKKTSKIVDIHLIEKTKNSDYDKERDRERDREKVKVKVPVLHTPAASLSTNTRPISNMIEQLENEKNRNRMMKKNSSEREKSNGEKNKIVIRKTSNPDDSKYHAELNLKRFNGIVANCIDPKSITYKVSDRATLLSERPKTTVPMDTCVNTSQHPTFLRKISTPPPLPNILDKLEVLNSPKLMNHYSSNYDHNLDHEIKVINSNHDAKSTISSSLRPVSITSSIRSGKSEKPLRLNHGLPPPPALNLKQESSPQKGSSNQQQTSSSSKKYDFNTKKILPLTSNLISKLKLSENKKPSNQDNELFIKETKSRPSENADETKKEKFKVQATLKKTDKPANTTSKKVSIEDDTKAKANVKTLVLNGMSTNIPVDENFGGRSTNLPQLGAIDYIYKTSDDRYMTSQSPFSYDKKVKSKESDKQSKHSSQNSSETPSTNRKNTTQKQYNNDEITDKYDSSLPWASKDLKNGKNFYENYAKENDRRKKEGNGFLMLLPGIAIPIDTDANDSDEDATSDSLD